MVAPERVPPRHLQLPSPPGLWLRMVNIVKPAKSGNLPRFTGQARGADESEGPSLTRLSPVLGAVNHGIKEFR